MAKRGSSKIRHLSRQGRTRSRQLADAIPPKKRTKKEEPTKKRMSAEERAQLEAAREERQARANAKAIEQVMQSIIGSAQPPEQKKLREEIKIPSIADITAAMDEGDEKKAARLMLEREEGRMQMLNQQWEERFGALEQTGLNTMAELQLAVSKQNLPHYDRFKDEIDRRLQALPGDRRINAATLKQVHDLVVGENLNDPDFLESLQQERQEKSGGPKPPKSGVRARSSRQLDNDDEDVRVKKPEELHPDITKLLKSKGFTGPDAGDKFAQSLGYDDWEHYMQLGDQYDEDEDLTNGKYPGMDGWDDEDDEDDDEPEDDDDEDDYAASLYDD